MPTQTFFNLEKEKQEHILHVAFEEFTVYEYEQASLNRIITNSEIAKGSFYRYFEHKRDLYNYLISYATGKKSTYIEEHFQLDTADFFENLSGIIAVYLQFNLHFPIYIDFLASAQRNNDITLAALYFLDDVDCGLSPLIKAGQEHGSVRKDYDAEMIVCCVTQVLLGLSSYIPSVLEQLSPQTMSIQEKGLENQELIHNTVNQFLQFLKDGFGTKESLIKK